MSELNTTAALSTALLSSAAGFGLAFYIAAKINKGMLSKSQKVLVYVAMTSFGLGLMGVLNELIGFPLQGLSIRGVKVLQYVVANIFIFPIVFLAIAYFLKKRMKQNETGDGFSQALKLGRNKIIINRLPATDDTDIYFEKAIIEYDSSDRMKGLYARLFSSHYGNENEVKAEYLKIRAEQLRQDELGFANDTMNQTEKSYKKSNVANQFTEVANLFSEKVFKSSVYSQVFLFLSIVAFIIILPIFLLILLGSLI
jgi:hypothetical protein